MSSIQFFSSSLLDIRDSTPPYIWTGNIWCIYFLYVTFLNVWLSVMLSSEWHPSCSGSALGVFLLCGTVFFISSRSTLSILLVRAELRAWLRCWLSCSWSCCWWFWLSARTRSSLRSEVKTGQGSQEYDCNRLIAKNASIL